jgi:hypothetical protein
MRDADRWRDRSAYLYGLALDEPEWAWEFLRRNRGFRQAARSSPDSVPGAPERAPGTAPLAAWGVHFRARP